MVQTYITGVGQLLKIWSQSLFCTIENLTFFKLYQTQGYHQLYSEHLQCYGFKFSLYKYVKISETNQLLHKHPYFLSASILILSKRLNHFAVFAFLSPLYFVVWQNTMQTVTVFSLAQIKLLVYSYHWLVYQLFPSTIPCTDWHWNGQQHFGDSAKEKLTWH